VAHCSAPHPLLAPQLRALSEEKARFDAFRQSLSAMLARSAPEWLASPPPAAAGGVAADSAAGDAGLLRSLEGELREKYELLHEMVLGNAPPPSRAPSSSAAGGAPGPAAFPVACDE
jgi:hypothetical protein